MFAPNVLISFAEGSVFEFISLLFLSKNNILLSGISDNIKGECVTNNIFIAKSLDPSFYQSVEVTTEPYLPCITNTPSPSPTPGM